ncbi:LysM domain-containing protein [Streptomyces sp. NPDC005820]|uniref:LysM peptidoglycan-binding domain-containing protein n=1 Tax=Streptomyces sp. NPDC005820 TaxID=3157069 RepID=UPI0033E83CF2
MSTARPEIGGTYTVREGDTITEIAFLAYGDARRYTDLAEHNKDVPGFVAARLRPGLRIAIPEPDYLPRPSGLGGMRGGAGQSFALRDERGGDR